MLSVYGFPLLVRLYRAAAALEEFLGSWLALWESGDTDVTERARVS